MKLPILSQVSNIYYIMIKNSYSNQEKKCINKISLKLN